MATPGSNDTIDPGAMDSRGMDSGGMDSGGMDSGGMDNEPGAPARYGPDIEELGKGGLGRVVRVHDHHLDRSVARKELLLPGVLLGTGPRARFEREARITARLEHPNILPVYEFGVDADGAPWYTTRAIRGQTLARAIEAAPTLAERLRLLPSIIATGQALAYAHGERVVHRDVTPRNIMVGAFGETVLIDWGLAKVLDDPDDDVETVALRPSALTAAGTPHGTIAYASPEQLSGDLARIDTRTDIWGLGATLHHLVTGRPPRRWEEPDAPIPPVRTVTPDTPAELGSIIDTALAPDPDHRYTTMAALVRDLVAWQAGNPVVAHRYGPMDHAQRFLRTRPREAAIGGIGALGLLLSLGGTGAVWFVKDGREQSARAGRAAAAAIVAAGEGRHTVALQQAVEALGVGEDPDVRGAVLAAGRRWIPTVTRRWQLVDCARALPSPDGVSVACFGEAEVRIEGPGATARWPLAASRAAWSPAGAELAVALAGGEVHAVAPGVAAPRLLGHVEGPPAALDWLDPQRLAVATSEGAVALLEGGNVTVVVPAGEDVSVLSIAHAGDLLVVGSAGAAHAWRLTTGAHVWRREGTAYGYLTMIPGQDLLVGTASTAEGNPFVETLALSTGEVLATRELPYGGNGRAVALPDGQTILVASAQGVVSALTVPELAVRATVDLDRALRSRLATGPDGALLVRADGQVEQWALPKAWPARVVDVAPGLIYAAAVSPAGERVLTPTSTGLLRAWAWPSLAPVQSWALTSQNLQATTWLDDAHPVTMGAEGNLYRLDSGGGGSTPVHLYDGCPYDAAALGGDRVLAGGQGGHIGVWDPVTGARVWSRDLEGVVVGLSVVSGGASAVVAQYLGGVSRLRVADGVEEQLVADPTASYCARTAAAPDGASVVLGASEGDHGRIERRAAADLTAVAWVAAVDGRPGSLAWSPDGRWIAAALLDGHLVILDAATGRLRARIRAHAGQAWGVTYVDDGRALLTTGSDGKLRAWDVADLDTPRATLLDHLAGP